MLPIISSIQQRIFNSYFRQSPAELRQARFDRLYTVALFRPDLDAIRSQWFPPESVQPELDKSSSHSIFDSIYQQYRCTQGDPLRCRETSKTLHCETCKFPTQLPQQSRIAGQLGQYQIEHWIDRQGMARVYAATQTETKQAIALKEYIFPDQYFNSTDRYRQKDTFKRLSGLTLADGRSQDARFLCPIETIADPTTERCYLIFDDRYHFPTLKAYLSETGAMPAKLVQQILNQILQTLELLHVQRFRLPAGQLQAGMAHGNLRLDTIRVAQQDDSLGLIPPTSHASPTLFLYLSDLALWEDLSVPPFIKLPPRTVASDLVAVGQIGFYLLLGGQFDAAGKPFDPGSPEHWMNVEPAFKHWLLRSLEIESPFESAAIARQALLDLASEQQIAKASAQLAPEPKDRMPKWVLPLLGLVGVMALGVMAWRFLPKAESAATQSPEAPAPCCINAVSIPQGQFKYTAVKNGTWSYVLQQPDLIEQGQTLEAKLKAAQPKLQLALELSDSIDQAVQKVQARTVDFAIAPLPPNQSADLEYQAIAYDGLAVVVAFSYVERQQGLPSQLNGQLHLDQLKQIYQAKVSNWQELGGSALPIKLYAPTDVEAVQLFENRVLQGKKLPSQDAISGQGVTQQSHFPMLRSILRDFEEGRTGGIGFAPLSKVFGQCAVYPLAIQTKEHKAIQLLKLPQEPIRPSTDLCNQKGSYSANREVMRSQQYPLTYPIVVIYSKDNDRSKIGAKFAEILKTQEGQKLLAQTGLVPLQD